MDSLFEDLIPEHEETIEESIVKLRKEGKTYRQIGTKLQVSQSKIAEVLTDAGLLGVQVSKAERERMLKIAPLFDEQIINTFIEFPFDYLAKRYGDFWKLSSDEKKKLTDLSNKVASKYLPLWLEQYADEIGLVVTFGIVIYPRYLMTKELVEKAKEKSPTPEMPETSSPVMA